MQPKESSPKGKKALSEGRQMTKIENWSVQIEIPMQGHEIGEMGTWLTDALTQEVKPAAQLALI